MQAPTFNPTPTTTVTSSSASSPPLLLPSSSSSHPPQPSSAQPLLASSPSSSSSPPSSSSSFVFPHEYHFPPFFTLQPASTTLAAQTAKWGALILAYCRHHRIWRLSVVDAVDTELFRNRRLGRRLALRDAREMVDALRRQGRAEWAGDAAASTLTGTAGLGSTGPAGTGPGGMLAAAASSSSNAAATAVAAAAAAAAAYSGGVGGASAAADPAAATVAAERREGGTAWIWWRKPEEWADVVAEWVDETAQKNTVLTLYELTESEATISQDFHGMDPEVLLRALSVLVKRGKAQVFGSEDQRGVKFF